MNPLDETLRTANTQDIEVGQFPGSTIRKEEYPRLVGGFPGPLVSDDSGAIRPIAAHEVDAGKVVSK